MTPRVAVRPAVRLEAHCVARLLSRHGLDAEVIGDASPPVDVVVELEWTRPSAGRSERVGREAGRSPAPPVLRMVMDDVVDLTDQSAVDVHLPIDSLVARVRDVATARHLDTPTADQAANQPAPLTPREREVARLLAEGCTNAAIARRLGISPHTARTHVQRVLAKLGVQRRAAVGVALHRQVLRSGRGPGEASA